MDQLNAYAYDGAKMVFGPLADAEMLRKSFGPAGGYVFAISVTATIILISSLSSLLYYWGILQKVVAAMAWVMMKTMRTSGSESLAGASNIFLGQTEAALVIKPYLPKMTQSEMMALMVTGFSTIATGVMAVYAGMEGLSAGHILTASVLGAPAGLLASKVMFPETEPSETGERCHFETKRTATNSIDALCTGASEGVMLSINVMAMLVAFVAVVALLNGLIVWPQQAMGVATPVTSHRSVRESIAAPAAAMGFRGGYLSLIVAAVVASIFWPFASIPFALRSKATTGSSKDIYSIVLFMVDTSLSGFFGSGERPTSAVERMRPTSSSGARPVNSTYPDSPSSSRRATSSSKQSPEPISVNAMSSRPSLCTTTSAARTTMSTPSWGPITPM